MLRAAMGLNHWMRIFTGRSGGGIWLDYWISILVCLALISVHVEGTISPGESRVKNKPPLKVIKSGARNSTLQELKLIKVEPTAKEILTYQATHHQNTSQSHFHGTVLGYLTPWNSLGYQVSQKFAGKFNILSPVWFQVTRNSKGAYEVTGSDAINGTWLNSFKKPNSPHVKIFPRFIVEKFSNHDYTQLLKVPDERPKLAKAIWEVCRQYGFDGVVFEIWLQLVNRVHKMYLHDLVLKLSNELHRIGDGLQLILVVPPLRDKMEYAFNAEDFEKLYDHVYAFSLMTYDYSSIQRPGANAPLYWVREAIEHLVPGSNEAAKRSKILMGMNLYGYVYTPDGGHAIIANEYLELLRQYDKRLKHDEYDKENLFEIRNEDGHQYIFYPTLYSIDERLKLAQEMGVGVSLWELGQGLDYFYDLF